MWFFIYRNEHLLDCVDGIPKWTLPAANVFHQTQFLYHALWVLVFHRYTNEPVSKYPCLQFTWCTHGSYDQREIQGAQGTKDSFRSSLCQHHFIHNADKTTLHLWCIHRSHSGCHHVFCCLPIQLEAFATDCFTEGIIGTQYLISFIEKPSVRFDICMFKYPQMFLSGGFLWWENFGGLLITWKRSKRMRTMQKTTCRRSHMNSVNNEVAQNIAQSEGLWAEEFGWN